MATCQGRHPLMRRTSIDTPVRPSRFEESLQTPGGTVQRDRGLAGPLGNSGRKIALSGLEIGLVRARASPGRRGAKERLETAGAGPEALSWANRRNV